MTELEERLRAELRHCAEHAPGGTLLAEQIIVAARTQPRPVRHRSWPTWSMPLLAAGAVAAIVTGVFVGVSQIRHSAGPAVPGIGTHAHTVTNSAPAPRPTPTLGATTPPSTGASATATAPDNPVGLANFTITDITFVGAQDGWALGSANCLSGPGRCPAMVHTADGGRTWRSMTQPPGAVTGIRFATDQIGYAFGPSTLEMTRDGGQSWGTQPGGAIALETLDGNVIRVVSSGSGCPGPCDVRVEYADVGGSVWTTATLATTRIDAYGVVLARSESDAYVLLTGHTAGGAGNAASTLYASADDGAHWISRGEPCQQPGDTEELDSVAVAASPGGRVALLCQARGTGVENLATSTDRGASFVPSAGSIPSFTADVVAGDPGHVLIAAGADPYRSTDGGVSWTRIEEVTGEATFAGFESPTLGRIVTDGGRTIWTTTDAGASWSAFTFPS